MLTNSWMGYLEQVAFSLLLVCNALLARLSKDFHKTEGFHPFKLFVTEKSRRGEVSRRRCLMNSDTLGRTMPSLDDTGSGGKRVCKSLFTLIFYLSDCTLSTSSMR